MVKILAVRLGTVLLGWTLVLPTVAMAADPVAVVTEIRAEGGQVEVKRVGESAWGAAQPLQALRAGDQIRAGGAARAAIVFTGGRGAQSVSSANSPFTVQPPAAAASGDKLRGLVGGVTDFLSGKQKDLAYLPLSVRNVRPPRVVQLAPRDTKILPGAVAFEWTGSDTRYLWQLETTGQPVQQTEFEILAPGDAARVRESLGILVPASLPGYPDSSVAIMRAGYLLRDGLYAEARRELLAAQAKDPDEPTLHLLLGQVYETTGLTDLAQREYVDARDLSARR